MDDIYTPAELERITGAKTGHKQAEILRLWGLNVWPNRKNEAILSREAFVRFQLGGMSQEAEREPVVRFG